jgi:putative ABC transport system permease protein
MRWYQRFFRRGLTEKHLDAELRYHLEQQIADYTAAGLTPEEARRRARLEFGGLDQVKEECRDVGAAQFVETLIQEIRYSLRQLRRNPSFAVVAALTLALGLAAVSTIFAVVETILLRPLDYPHPDRIFSVSEGTMGGSPSVVTLREFQSWQKSGLFEHTAVLDTAAYTLLGSGHPERLSGVRVTPDFFRVFMLQPFLGRGFEAGGATTGHDGVMVLSYARWMSSFGGDRGVVGRSVRMSEGPMTVIGVMPPAFDFPRLADVRSIMEWGPEQPDFWIPLSITEQLVEEGNYNYYMLGRLRDGITAKRASEQLRASALQIYRDAEGKEPAFRNEIEQAASSLIVYVVPLRDTMAWGVQKGLWMLLTAVALLLVLVLFNLGNLLLTRNTNRFREFMVREALGATPGQLFRQSLVEQALVVGGAGVLSLLLAGWGVTAVRATVGTRLPRLYALGVDVRVTLLVVVLSLVIAAVFAALPLLVVRSPRLSAALQSEGRSLTADRRTSRARFSLMALQVAVSMVLLIGSGLLIRSFTNVLRVAPGFDPHHLLNITVPLDPKKNQNPAARLAHLRDLLAALRSIPGVESATVVNHIPLIGAIDIHAPQAMEGPSSSWRSGAEYRIVDASYFRTMRIPLLAGREFREDEPRGSAIINHKMAAQLWPGQDALGKQLKDEDNPPVTVVGIVGDVHDGSLESEPGSQFYQPLAAGSWSAESFVLRTRIAPEAVLPIAQKTVWRLDPEAPVCHPQTMERLLESVTLDRRFETGLVAGFAAAALALATLGLFSVASLSTARRTREFGIRMALGATGHDLLRLEMGRTLTMVAAGLVAGVGVSVTLAKVVAGLLYGVTPWSPAVYIAAVAVLVVPALVAAWIPARRATKVHPMVALRYE